MVRNRSGRKEPQTVTLLPGNTVIQDKNFIAAGLIWDGASVLGKWAFSVTVLSPVTERCAAMQLPLQTEQPVRFCTCSMSAVLHDTGSSNKPWPALFLSDCCRVSLSVGSFIVRTPPIHRNTNTRRVPDSYQVK